MDEELEAPAFLGKPFTNDTGPQAFRGLGSGVGYVVWLAFIFVFAGMASLTGSNVGMSVVLFSLAFIIGIAAGLLIWREVRRARHFDDTSHPGEKSGNPITNR